ncbi:hypothetical protein ACFL9T_19875 [Thermodesulfobacteriota bacterium]
MKIDIFAHILPPKYLEAVKGLSLINPDYVNGTRTLSDLDARFRVMDKYDEYVNDLQHIDNIGIHVVDEVDRPGMCRTWPGLFSNNIFWRPDK